MNQERLTALLADAELIVRALDDWSDRLGRQYGPLSRPQRRMLLALERRMGEEAVRVSELAEQLGLSAAGATRMLDTLEGLGYLRRYRAPMADQRQVYVQLVPAGIEALSASKQVILQRVCARIDRLTEEERTTLVALLHRVVQPEENESD